jgi:hypothetical protein
VPHTTTLPDAAVRRCTTCHATGLSIRIVAGGVSEANADAEPRQISQEATRHMAPTLTVANLMTGNLRCVVAL